MVIHYFPILGEHSKRFPKEQDYKTVKEFKFKSPWKLLDWVLIFKQFCQSFSFSWNKNVFLTNQIMCQKKLRRDPESAEPSFLPLVMFPSGRLAGFPGCWGPRGTVSKPETFPWPSVRPSSFPHLSLLQLLSYLFLFSGWCHSCPRTLSRRGFPVPSAAPSLPAQSLGGTCHLETQLWVALVRGGSGLKVGEERSLGFWRVRGCEKIRAFSRPFSSFWQCRSDFSFAREQNSFFPLESF